MSVLDHYPEQDLDRAPSPALNQNHGVAPIAIAPLHLRNLSMIERRSAVLIARLGSTKMAMRAEWMNTKTEVSTRVMIAPVTILSTTNIAAAGVIMTDAAHIVTLAKIAVVTDIDPDPLRLRRMEMSIMKLVLRAQ